MRKIILSLLFALSLTSVSFSQNIRLNAYSFYTLDDNISASNGNYYFNGTIKGNLLWGGGLEFNPGKDVGIEVAYFRQDTDVPTTYNSGIFYNETFKLGANYIMIGGTKYIKLPGKTPVVPFAGAMLGLAILENKEPILGAESSVTKFAWQLKAGVNIMASPQFGIKLQAHLLSAVQGVGGGLYLGSGGAGAGLNTYSSMLQLGFGGGLVFNFGKTISKQKIINY